VINTGQTITYRVRSIFDYYVMMQPGSTVVFESNTPGGSVTVSQNIWGPGTLKISCSMVMNGSMGVCPPAAALQGLPVYQYTGTNIIEVI
jgi:hypothetical protein